MIVKVAMLAHHENNVIRDVEIEWDDKWDNTGRHIELLGAVFRMGQNDFQPVPGICSVSIGDVIILDAALGFGVYHLVCSMGFADISEQQYISYGRLGLEDRKQRAKFLGNLSIPKMAAIKVIAVDDPQLTDIVFDEVKKRKTMEWVDALVASRGLRNTNDE